MKKIITIIIIISAVCLSLFWLKQNNNKNPEQKIRLAYSTDSINHGPIMVALEKNLFSKHELNIELIATSSSSAITQGLSTGQIDIGVSGATNLFIPISAGAPVKILTPLAVSASRLYVRPDSGLKTITDLRGKKISLRPNGANYYSISYALIAEGVDPNEMEFIDIDRPYQPLALMEQKSIDAVGVSDFEQPTYEKIGAVLLEDWENGGYLKNKMPRATIAINTNFSDQDPKLVEGFLDALIEAQIFIKENPGEAAELISRHINDKSNGAVELTSGEILEAWKDAEYRLWIDPNILVQMSKIAQNVGEIDRTLSEEEIFEQKFQDKLHQAQLEVYEK